MNTMVLIDEAFWSGLSIGHQRSETGSERLGDCVRGKRIKTARSGLVHC